MATAVVLEAPLSLHDNGAIGGIADSLVALHAQPLDATQALSPAVSRGVVDRTTSRPKRKSTKRARPTGSSEGDSASVRPKRKYTKRKHAEAEPPVRVKRKYTFIKRKHAGGIDPEPVVPKPPPKPKLYPRAPLEVVGAATRWRMPPPERLLARMPKAVAKYLQLTRPEEFEKFRIARLAEIRRRREIHERERRLATWLSKGTELPPHMLREPPPPLPRTEIERPEPAIAEKVEQPLVRVYKSACSCGACRRVHHERAKSHNEYVCRMERCRQKFCDIVAFVDHQIDTHATVNVHCKRTREEYFGAQDGTVYPPETVYIVEQYANATQPPEMWSLERVEQEKESLDERIKALRYVTTFRTVPKAFMRLSFKVAYEKVQLYGLAELREQHRIALEHYEAALVFPVGPRNRQDVIAAVHVGRNWLLSPEPENSELSRVLKIEKRDDEMETSKETASDNESEDDDEEEEEEEVVLFYIGGERESGHPSNRADPLVKKQATGVDKSEKASLATEFVKKHRMHRARDAPDVICI